MYIYIHINIYIYIYMCRPGMSINSTPAALPSQVVQAHLCQLCGALFLLRVTQRGSGFYWREWELKPPGLGPVGCQDLGPAADKGAVLHGRVLGVASQGTSRRQRRTSMAGLAASCQLFREQPRSPCTIEFVRPGWDVSPGRVGKKKEKKGRTNSTIVAG